MKKSGILKVVAAFILFVSIVVMTLSSITVYFVFQYGSNFDGGTKLTLDIADQIAAIYANEIRDHYVALKRGYVNPGTEQAFNHRYSEDNTNIRYRVIEWRDKEIFNNFGENKDQDMLVVYKTTSEASIRVEVGIPLELNPVDLIYWVFGYVTFSSMYYSWVIAIAVLSLIISILSSVYICASAGHRRKQENIHLGFFARMPIELYIILFMLIVSGCVYLIENIPTEVAVLLVFVIGIVTFIGLLFSLSARLKSTGWYKNSVIWKALSFIYRYVIKPVGRLLIKAMIIIAKINLYWKTALVSLGFLSLYLFFAYKVSNGGLWFIISLFLIQLVLTAKFVLDLKRLERAGGEISGGNANAKIDKETLLPSLRRHAESLNNIGEGIDEAVKRSIKSERMKTELITNVSHDIKTPLTSIINYVELLKREGLNAEKAPEYLDVLDRQSARLKKMTEDLVEASKAASGTLSFTPEQTDVNIILYQALGEYEEKLASNALNVVVRKDEDVNTVYADGKLMWRIFDNVLSNICKYALHGTRVFVEITRNENAVRTEFKNVSAEPLDVSPEELMERFVRGDSSRNTEGSGLGLSIAKSLAELQGGSFTIEIDGDMFKSTVIFPLE